MKLKTFLPLLLLLLVYSCQSNGMLLREKEHRESPLMAKVYNGENRACAGVTLSLGTEKKEIFTAQTDITGKALFPRVPYGSYVVSMKKKGYERVSFVFDYERADQALYGRLYSFEIIMKQGIMALEKGKWQEAIEYIERAEAIEGDIYLTTFYRAIWEWKTGNPQNSVQLLEDLKEKEGYLPKEMVLYLADLYQYDLDDREVALTYLDELLIIEDNSDIRERRDLLRNQGE